MARSRSDRILLSRLCSCARTARSRSGSLGGLAGTAIRLATAGAYAGGNFSPARRGDRRRPTRRGLGSRSTGSGDPGHKQGGHRDRPRPGEDRRVPAVGRIDLHVPAGFSMGHDSCKRVAWYGPELLSWIGLRSVARTVDDDARAHRDSLCYKLRLSRPAEGSVRASCQQHTRANARGEPAFPGTDRPRHERRDGSAAGRARARANATPLQGHSAPGGQEDGQVRAQAPRVARSSEQSQRATWQVTHESAPRFSSPSHVTQPDL